MTANPPQELPTATDARARIEAGTLSCEDMVRLCLANIEQREDEVRAFAHVDPTAALEVAVRLDRESSSGLLRGIPVAVKDVFETAFMPTEYNSPLYEGHVAGKDAACVGILRSQGAVILGKASTVEFASLGRVPPTTNPLDAKRTPGGSSGGSAAAVAAGMVPVALATQTGGSTIRPASFCGVAAMKPTYGRVAVDGMRAYAPSLDTIGWITKSSDDLALVARALRVAETIPELSEPPVIGVYQTPYWDSAEASTHDAMRCATEVFQRAGATIVEIEGPDNAGRLNEAQNIIMHGEGRAAYLNEYLRWPEDLAPALRDEVENTMGITADMMAWAYDYLSAMRPKFDQCMQGCDAWLTPAVPGEATVGLDSTGDAVFNRLWTGLHMPVITLPAAKGQNGMPVGIQLVAPRFSDARLLAVARFAEAAILRNAR